MQTCLPWSLPAAVRQGTAVPVHGQRHWAPDANHAHEASQRDALTCAQRTGCGSRAAGWPIERQWIGRVMRSATPIRYSARLDRTSTRG
jgi:hypothetical protein